MKTNAYGALMILALAMVVSLAPLAQAQSQARCKANVPFEFSMDQTTMAAGNYEISQLSDKVLVVRNLDTRNARLLIATIKVQASQAEGTPHAKLVFHRYGDQYFLAEIWDGQHNQASALPESKREKEVKWASNNAEPEVIVLAMK